ncbi:MAG: phosphotyrosine protein phosphatase [Candidatus Rokubacteria bacterium]|nr:phosphotyrosine protein phosphatase [Candidatus Rokubacteria bacterium]
MKILFVCTGNIARSPTAEALFGELTRGQPHEARSVGTSPSAPHPLAEADLAWADVVAVMEPAHRGFLEAYWPTYLPKVRVLGIPDLYPPHDPVLRELLAGKILALLAGS